MVLKGKLMKSKTYMKVEYSSVICLEMFTDGRTKQKDILVNKLSTDQTRMLSTETHRDCKISPAKIRNKINFEKIFISINII